MTLHIYTSTACIHKRHDDCRHDCKYQEQPEPCNCTCHGPTNPHTRLLSWDYREQPDLDALGRILTELTAGQIHLREVETGDDQYAITISATPLTPDEAVEAYDTRRDEDEQ